MKQMKLAWIVVSDLNASIDFFCNKLGLKLHTKDEQFGWAELGGTDGGAYIGLAQASDHTEIPAGHNAVLTLTVSNIKEAKEDLTKKGVNFKGEIIEVPGIVKLQTFTDLDGNMFQLVEELSGNM